MPSDTVARQSGRFCTKCGGSWLRPYDPACAHEMGPPEPSVADWPRVSGDRVERVYIAHGDGLDRTHPTREGAIAAWQAAWLARWFADLATRAAQACIDAAREKAAAETIPAPAEETALTAAPGAGESTSSWVTVKGGAYYVNYIPPALTAEERAKLRAAVDKLSGQGAAPLGGTRDVARSIALPPPSPPNPPPPLPPNAPTPIPASSYADEIAVRGLPERIENWHTWEMCDSNGRLVCASRGRVVVWDHGKGHGGQTDIVGKLSTTHGPARITWDLDAVRRLDVRMEAPRESAWVTKAREEAARNAYTRRTGAAFPPCACCGSEDATLDIGGTTPGAIAITATCRACGYCRTVFA